MNTRARYGQARSGDILVYGETSKFGYLFPELANDPDADATGSNDPIAITEHLKALGQAMIDPEMRRIRPIPSRPFRRCLPIWDHLSTMTRRLKRVACRG